MLEWIGVCCCSSFVSCICSLIATAFCLSPNGVCLRQCVRTDYARSEKPKRLSKIVPDTVDRKTSRRNRRKSATPRSGSSCECMSVNCPMRYRSKFDYSHDPTLLTPCITSPNKTGAEDTLQMFVPRSKICQPSFTQALQTARDSATATEVEMRKRIDEYNAVFKQFKDLIEDSSKNKRISETSEAWVQSTKESLGVNDNSTSSSPQQVVASRRSSAFSSSPKKPEKQVSNRSEISMSKENLQGKEEEKENSVFWPIYNDHVDHRDKGEKSFSPVSPIVQRVEYGDTKSPLTSGWQYRMKKGVRKVCERMIRVDGEKNWEFKSAEKTD